MTNEICTIPDAKTILAERAARMALAVLPCSHETGAIATYCPQGDEQKHVRDCDLHGLVTRKDNCASCDDHKAEGAAVLITGGIGDAIALEGLWSPEFRERLETIYYACPAAKEISHLFQSLPNYPRLAHHIILPSGSKVHYTIKSVRADHEIPEGVEDWSIATAFPRKLAYRGSSFLTYPLATVTMPTPYAVIVPASSWGRWQDRGFSQADWKGCLAALESADLTGVIVGRERITTPTHERLVNLTGRTGILESVELVKRAAGYIGIDSWASVLAAKLFPASRLAVKSVWGHLYEWKHIYYAPRDDFRFVRRSLEGLRWS